MVELGAHAHLLSSGVDCRPSHRRCSSHEALALTSASLMPEGDLRQPLQAKQM